MPGPRHSHQTLAAASTGSASRHFDVTISGFLAKDADDPRMEDTALTEYLMPAWRELCSLSPNPVPACPRCHGRRTRYLRPAATTGYPTYRCVACRRTFNRLTGTPFARLRHQSKATELIPMLGRQIALVHVGKQTGLSYPSILSWLLAFRCYLLELDPSGHWEARVKLGMHALPHARCIRCGFEGGFLSGAFDIHGRRRIRCPQCGRHRLLDVSQSEGQAFEAVVLRDSCANAVRRKRRRHPNVTMPPVTSVARVDEAARDVAMRTRPKLDDIVLPERPPSSDQAHRHEDATLSAFLLKHVDALLSDDSAPRRCPWCGSDRVASVHPRPGGLPRLSCDACLAWFTKVSNTPLVTQPAREHARRFVTMLGWHESARVVARELGVPRQTVVRWIQVWRQWLLVLDPTGEMEARVKLELCQIPPSETRDAGQQS